MSTSSFSFIKGLPLAIALISAYEKVAFVSSSISLAQPLPSSS
ncbi:hypothetical protein [Thomasclavelia ramosa]